MIPDEFVELVIRLLDTKDWEYEVDIRLTKPIDLLTFGNIKITKDNNDCISVFFSDNDMHVDFGRMNLSILHAFNSALMRRNRRCESIRLNREVVAMQKSIEYMKLLLEKP